MWSLSRHFAASLLLLLSVAGAGPAEDITELGGDLSIPRTGASVLQAPAPNLLDPARLSQQVLGFPLFHSPKTESKGLGPKFINSSCAGCHINNGKGKVEFRKARRRENTMVVKVSLEGQAENGAPIDVPGIGEQLQDRSVSGEKTRIRLRERVRRRGKLKDGTPFELVQPIPRFRISGFKRRELRTSLRMAPMLIGEGLLEAIPDQAILALSDPNDSDRDGISGRPNYVPNRENGLFEIGRYGFRASHPTLRQQSAAASFFDMGVANSLFNNGADSSELSDEDLEKLTAYQALPSVPSARRQSKKRIMRGKTIFQRIGCADCHVMSFTTGESRFPELENQTIHPFTDLLLHDMGPGLADERAEFSAAGSEWRTTPLWGLGFAKTVSRVRPRYLHDGRARTITEAIMWHGGEARKARQKFRRLKKGQRKALLRFLDSL